MNYYSEYRCIFIGSFCALLISSHQEGLWSVINDISSFLQIFQSLSEGRLDVPWVLHYHFHFSQAFICLVNHFQTYVWWSFWSSPWEVMPWSITSGVSSLVSRGWINFFHLPSFRELLCIVRCQNMSGKKISDQAMWSKVFFQCWKGLCPHRKLGIHVEGSERSSLTERRWHKPNRASTEEGRGAAGCSTAPVASPSVHHSDLWPLRKVKPIVLLRTRLQQMWYRVFAQFMSKHLTTWPTEEIHFDLSISDWHPGPRMSASDQMRAMLDQLMGTQRNGES